MLVIINGYYQHQSSLKLRKYVYVQHSGNDVVVWMGNFDTLLPPCHRVPKKMIVTQTRIRIYIYLLFDTPTNCIIISIHSKTTCKGLNYSGWWEWRALYKVIRRNAAQK